MVDESNSTQRHSAEICNAASIDSDGVSSTKLVDGDSICTPLDSFKPLLPNLNILEKNSCVEWSIYKIIEVDCLLVADCNPAPCTAATIKSIRPIAFALFNFAIPLLHRLPSPHWTHSRLKWGSRRGLHHRLITRFQIYLRQGTYLCIPDQRHHFREAECLRLLPFVLNPRCANGQMQSIDIKHRLQLFFFLIRPNG